MEKETVMGNFLIYSVGVMATVFAVSSTLPQILKTLKSKKTDDISIWLSIVLIAGLGLWVAYGVFKNDVVLIYGNSIAVLLNSIMLFLKIKYSKNPLN
jgi:MtN3 and saliva related transmembrane protein